LEPLKFEKNIPTPIEINIPIPIEKNIPNQRVPTPRVIGLQ